MRINMLAFPFYLTAIFTQVYHLYGTNSTIQITSAETSIHLQWSVSDLNSSYAIMYGVSDNALDINRENVTLPADTSQDVTHTIEGLDPGQHYNIQLHKDGVLIFQDFIATNPLPVVNPKASVATATSILISWSRAPGSIQDKFQVLVQGVSNSSFQYQSENVTDPVCTVPSLGHSQYYRATVVAFSNGEPSNQSAVIEFNTAPLAPSQVTVVAIDTRILNISWTPDSQSNQDSYKIQYLYNASNGNALEVNKTCDPPTATTCQVEITGGLPGQVYEVLIYSVLGTAVSEAAMTVHSTVPLSVTSLEEVPDNATSIHLRWAIPSDNTFYFRHFVLHVRSDYGNMNWDDINKHQQEFVMTGLQLGTAYNVSAYTSTGYEVSQPLAKVFYTNPMSVDGITNDPSTDTNITTFTVHWTINQTSLYDEFSLDISPLPENSTYPQTVSKDTTQYTFTDLSPGHDYQVSMVTRLAGKESSPISSTFRTVPNKPQDVIVYNVTSSQVQVQWNLPSGTVDSSRITLLLSGSEEKKVTQTGTKYTFLNLQPGTEYDVKVESQSGALFSEAVTQSVVTNPSSVPNLSLTNVTSYSITVTWEAPNDTNFAQYELRISPADVTTPVRLAREIQDTTFTFSPLKSGHLYTVDVYTVSSSTLSERLADQAVTNPLPVEQLTAVPQGNGLNVSWSVNASSLQSGFVVSYQTWPIGPLTTLPIVPSEASVYDYTIEVTDLFPGGNYRVRVQAWQNVSGISAASDNMEIIATTVPKPVENLTAEIVDVDTIEVDWSKPTDSIHSYYLVRHRPSLRDTNAEWMVNSTLSKNFTLVDLFPGEQYEIEVYVFSDTEVRSEAKVLQVVLDPLPPASVGVLSNQTSTTSVTLQWLYDRSATYVEHWLVTYTDPAGGAMDKTVPSSAGVDTVEVMVTGLVAGYPYDMTVKAVVKDKVSSTGTVTKAITKPLNSALLYETAATNDSITLSYTISESDYYDSILFSLTDTKQNVVHQKGQTPQELTFTGLEAGTVYTVTFRTISGTEMSERNLFTANTAPNPPELLSSVTAHDITLTIVHPAAGNVDTYSVRCVDVNSAPVKVVTPAATKDDLVIFIDMLEPYMHYTCMVKSVYKGTESTEVSVAVRTEQASSSEVRNLVAVEKVPREVTLSWDMPEFQNGVIQTYIVSYTGVLGDGFVHGKRNVTFPSSTAVFSSLKAGWTYTFSVRAYTTSASEPAKITISLRTYKPSYKPDITEEQATPKSEPGSVGTTKFKVTFTNAFSDDLGQVEQYTVIVTENKDSVDVRTKNTLPGWNTARNDPAIKAYQVISNCSNLFEESSDCDGKFGVSKRAANEVPYKTFEIGSETGCENRYYCNGPLQPDKTYYVTLRAYTTMEYQDTPFSEPIKTAAIPVEESGSNVGGIVGGVVTAVVIIVFIIVVGIFVKRRRNTKSTMYQHNPGQELSHRLSVGKKTHVPIHLAEFRDHVLKLKADSDLGYAEQFEDLKDVGRGQACTAAELPCNRGKNRFTNILPYDHSRVKLLPIDDDEGSDYINANYIPGFHSKREYIVTQGALPATRDDFWRMLWEQNVRNIVMLTKCVEKGREKCDHYWPTSSDAVFYGDLQVAILNETVFPDWTIIEFKVSLGDQSRQVRHFHFTSWPDFGVPKKEQVLVRFVRMVREKLQKDGGPIIVHCSAGVGRSGTFAVLDRLLQRMQSYDTLDIYNSVAELRKERVWMVQTEQQYVCIHNSLLCVVEGREDEHIYDNVGHANVAFEDDEGVDLN